MRLFTIILIFGLFPVFGRAQESVRLVEKGAPGTEYRVITEATIRGELLTPVAKDKPPERIKISGKSSIDYSERILVPEANDQAEHKVIRYYDKIDFRKTTADRTDEISLRPEVKRVVIMKRGAAKLSFSPDGPLMWGELDMLRTDFIIPALAGLMPTKDLKVGDTWSASAAAVTELTDIEKLDKGSLDCKLEKIEVAGPRQIAHVAFSGTLDGVNEDGPTRQKLTGKFLVDLKAQCISYLKIDGEHIMLDDKGQQAGRILGSFEMTRSTGGAHKALSGERLKGLALSPNEDNSHLLHDTDGIRFVYPRSWKVSRSAGKQITLDEESGAGMLITVDVAKSLPKTDGYLREAIQEMRDRGGKVTARHGPDIIVEGVERFTLDVTLEKETFTMDYFVIRQANGGATLATRIPTKFREVRMKEVERIARSFRVPRKLEEK
jgi:hypothetical protein